MLKRYRKTFRLLSKATETLVLERISKKLSNDSRKPRRKIYRRMVTTFDGRTKMVKTEINFLSQPSRYTSLPFERITDLKLLIFDSNFFADFFKFCPINHG